MSRLSTLKRIGWVYFRMSRPLQVVAVILVYSLGALIAASVGHKIVGKIFWPGLAALLPVSISIHYANEYADFETDGRTIRTPFSGGSGALHETRTNKSVAIIGAWGALLLGAGVATNALLQGGLTLAPLFVLGLGAFFGWMYSLPPLALAWRGWGELTNALLGGVVLPVYGYAVQSSRVDWQVVVGCLPFAGLVFINLLATTWPDREADKTVGKFTLATRWSIPRLRLTYAAVAGLSFVVLPFLVGNILPLPVVLGSLPVLPLVFWGVRSYTRSTNPFPTVAAMSLMLIVQLIAWGTVVLRMSKI